MANPLGKTIYHKRTGEELGRITKSSLKAVWVGEKRYSRKDIVFVKKSKRPRKGKAPDPTSPAYRRKQRAEDNAIRLPKLDIPAFLKRQAPDPQLTQSDIQIKCSGLNAAHSKVFESSQRSFDTVEEAQEYLKKFTEDREMEMEALSNNGRVCRLRDSSFIWSNYKLFNILEGKAPTSLLPNIIREQIKPTIKKEKTMTATKKTTTKTSTQSQMVVLKKVCQELDLDPRKARMKLRKTVGTTDGRWEWPADSKELQQVKDILSGKETKPAPKKKAPAKKTPVKKTTTRRPRKATAKK